MDLLLFKGAVRFLLRGRESGNFHPHIAGSAERRLAVLDEIEARQCFSPRPLFTDIAVWDHDSRRVRRDARDPRFIRTVGPADAGLTRNAETAVSFWNADCPIGVLYHAERETLAVVHCGLGNVFRNGRTTLEEAVRKGSAPAKEYAFWFGGGVGPCCYGLTDAQVLTELQKRFGQSAVLRSVQRGPRRGIPAVHLQHIVETLASELGIEAVASDRTCTGCLSDSSGTKMFWSHVYGDSERNGAFVKRTAT